MTEEEELFAAFGVDSSSAPDDGGEAELMAAFGIQPPTEPQQSELSLDPSLVSAPPMTVDTAYTGSGSVDDVNATVNAPQQKPFVPLSERVHEMFTGAKRQTEQTRTLPNWTDLPELDVIPSIKAGKGLEGFQLAMATAFGGSQDQIRENIQRLYPDMKVEFDEKKNPIVTSTIDGKKRAIDAGLTVGDVPAIINNLLSIFIPGSKGGITAAATREALVQGVEESTRALGGQEITLAGVASRMGLAGGLGAGGRAVEKGMFGAGSGAQKVDLINEGVGGSPDATAAILKANQDNPEALKGALDIAGYKMDDAGKLTTPTVTQQSLKEASDISALRPTVTREQKLTELGRSVPVKEETLAQAKRLDVLEDMTPQQLIDTTEVEATRLMDSFRADAMFDRMAQERAIKIGDKFRGAIKAVGAEDIGEIGPKIKAFMISKQDFMKNEAEKRYKRIEKQLPQGATADVSGTMDHINKQVKNITGSPPVDGFYTRKQLNDLGVFSTDELAVYNVLRDNPSYQALSEMKSRIGSRLSDNSSLGPLYSVMKRDKQNSLDGLRPYVGDSGVSVLDKADELYAKSFELDNHMKRLFGAKFKQATRKDLIAGTKAAAREVMDGGAAAFEEMIGAVPKRHKSSYIKSCPSATGSRPR